MKLLRPVLMIALALGWSLALAQSPWGIKQAYDLNANKMLSEVSLDLKTIHPSVFGVKVLPAWSIVSKAWSATYTGQKGFGGGGSIGIATTWKGIELFGDFGKGFFNTYKGPHSIITFGFTVRPNK